MIRRELPREALLRPVGELYVIFACLSAVLLIFCAYEYLFMNKYLATTSIVFLLYLAYLYSNDAYYILRYQSNLKVLRPYTIKSQDIIYTPRYVELGRGFDWLPIHTQRLKDTQLPENRSYIKPSETYRTVRNFCIKNHDNKTLKPLISALEINSILNPFRPLPPIGGMPALHGIEPNDAPFYWLFGKRVGHTGIFGTTRTGKSRLAELIIAHDIRAGAKKIRNSDNTGNVVVIFDPKGDGELLRRVIYECKSADRLDEFYMIHLGFPELSHAYNPIGDYQKITEVAGRSTNQLADGGNSSAFKEFSWRFVNINAQALEFIGEEVSYEVLQHYINYTDELLEKYLKKRLGLSEIDLENLIEDHESELDANILKKSTRPKRTLAIMELAKEFLKQNSQESDAILKGLVSALEYDKTYYDKLVASLLPFLDKMTTGNIKDLFSPKKGNKRMRWRDVVAKRGVVYIGLDALTDPVIAGAFASSCLSDLVSLTGEIYKKGSVTDEPDFLDDKQIPILAHLDEFNELVSGDEIIQLLNKAGGAGVMAHLYTQTLKDIEAKLGDSAKASQIIGNLQNIIMMRVREVETAELLTSQLPKVEVSSVTDVGGTSDDGSLLDFQTNNSDRKTTKEVPMIEPSDVIALPVGEAFMLNDGGNCRKLRFPMIEDCGDFQLKPKVDAMIKEMKQKYRTSENWSRNDKT
ncbi:type IV conjugative transfer system coupling protein TraD [Pseudoalteromonas sp. SR41-6]|uniref:type IV conjugative transfer system coupling protein TraD n=1 Tax=Pseudoalteromonas sp. SR41-6 TaxID=2760948 RepID=UPI0015FFCBAC|nr:type IV conjugative transfer system coupling protein TraD [Pseudoalteromonas sp. SR41-6]MBB1334016.1 type IV conjugative transfer system coupling protein TraD [Pseudoalteromonas sp. SR41-6]